MHKQELYNKKEWMLWNNESKRPHFIPQNPEKAYKDKGWIDWDDWLGRPFLSFNRARTYIRKLGFRNRKRYTAWLNSGKRPKFIPPNPEEFYNRIGWNGIADWLGINIENGA